MPPNVWMGSECEKRRRRGGQIGEAGESILIEKEREEGRRQNTTVAIMGGISPERKKKRKERKEAKTRAELDGPQPENSES